MSCCRASRLLFPKDFCSFLEQQGPSLPIKLEETDHGLQFRITFAGSVLDLFDAVDVYACTLGNAKAVRSLRENVLRLTALVNSELANNVLSGQTYTLNRLINLYESQVQARK